MRLPDVFVFWPSRRFRADEATATAPLTVADKLFIALIPTLGQLQVAIDGDVTLEIVRPIGASSS